MYGLVSPRFFNLYADIAGIFFAAIMSYIAYSSENCPKCEPEVINQLPIPQKNSLLSKAKIQAYQESK